MHVDSNKTYIGEIKNSIKNEISAFQRMGNVLHLSQRAIIMKCDKEEFISSVLENCFSVIQSIAPAWFAKKMADYRRKEFPRTIPNCLDKQLVMNMALKTGLLHGPWYTTCGLFKNMYCSKPDTVDKFEAVLQKDRGCPQYKQFISELSDKILSDMPMVLLADGESLRQYMIHDIMAYIIANNGIRIGALLWIIVIGPDYVNIKELPNKEDIPTIVL